MRATGCEVEMGPREGPEIYGFVGGAWHGLAPLRCHVTALLRRKWTLSAGAQLGRQGSFLGGCTSRREVALFPSSCLSLPSLPGLDLTIHLRRLRGISRCRHVEDWRCFERSSCWNWVCFWEFWYKQQYVCLCAVVPIPLTADVMAVTALPHTSKWEALSPGMTACVSKAPPVWHQHV